MSNEQRSLTDQEALDFHRYPTPGKIAVTATKPMATQRDLGLAYSPGVAEPCLHIAARPVAGLRLHVARATWWP
jgi:malate dehydrogenase (oxaloacetate-decarboxylating)(NADP+)